MPLPIILGLGAAIAGIAGVGNGIHGAAKMKEANETMEYARKYHEKHMRKFERQTEATNKTMDELGALELTILQGFEKFSDTIERIQNRPQFQAYRKDGVELPAYDGEELKNVSIGAGVLLGGLGGAAAGTAGGFAAAGAATTAVMAFGTASTGTAISALSGAAATNATLAALGGGSLAVGGGGIALGTTVLGAATFGVGLLVGGLIFNVTGSSLSDKADEAMAQAKTAGKTIDRVCEYLSDLEGTASAYSETLKEAYDRYLGSFGCISHAVNDLHKSDWRDFTEEEKAATQNSVLLVGLLYKMCQVCLVKKAEEEDGLNSVNTMEIEEAVNSSIQVMDSLVM